MVTTKLMMLVILLITDTSKYPTTGQLSYESQSWAKMTVEQCFKTAADINAHANADVGNQTAACLPVIYDEKGRSIQDNSL